MQEEMRGGEIFVFCFLSFVLYHLKISIMKETLAMCAVGDEL